MKTQLKKQSYRLDRIGAFFKTEHFLYRQWERKITDEMLLFSLAKVSPTTSKMYIIVSRKSIKNFDRRNSELFILVHKKKLITCFCQKIENFQSDKHKRFNYQIVNK